MNYKELRRIDKVNIAVNIYLKLAPTMQSIDEGLPMKYWKKKIQDEIDNMNDNIIYDTNSLRSIFDILYKDCGFFLRYGDKKNYTYDIVNKEFDGIRWDENKNMFMLLDYYFK